MFFKNKHNTQFNYDDLLQTDALAASVGTMMSGEKSACEDESADDFKHSVSAAADTVLDAATEIEITANDEAESRADSPIETEATEKSDKDELKIQIDKDGSMPLISLRHISKIYKMGDEELRANDDISLDINRGEFVAIVGKSGSGKSTLMNIIGALDVPTEGNYYLDGRDTSKMNDNELAEVRNHKLGFIFQQYNLLPKLSILENVELPLLYQGVREPERKQKAMQELEKVGLKDKAYNRPKQLSGGQQQRVSIARALAGSPSIILADEPTGALDSKTGREVLGFLKQLNAEGNTIIMISHDPTLAIQAKRVVQIMDGRITFDGSAEEYGKL